MTCRQNPRAGQQVRKYLPDIVGAGASQFSGRNNGDIGDDSAGNDAVIRQRKKHDDHAEPADGAPGRRAIAKHSNLTVRANGTLLASSPNGELCQQQRQRHE
jgi:hypothetical protein